MCFLRLVVLCTQLVGTSECLKTTFCMNIQQSVAVYDTCKTHEENLIWSTLKFKMREACMP